jgi:hypothetical protein
MMEKPGGDVSHTISNSSQPGENPAPTEDGEANFFANAHGRRPRWTGPKGNAKQILWARRRFAGIYYEI